MTDSARLRKAIRHAVMNARNAEHETSRSLNQQMVAKINQTRVHKGDLEKQLQKVRAHACTPVGWRASHQGAGDKSESRGGVDGCKAGAVAESCPHPFLSLLKLLAWSLIHNLPARCLSLSSRQVREEQSRSEAQRNSLAQALEAKRGPLAQAKERFNARKARPDREMVQDEVEQALAREIAHLNAVTQQLANKVSGPLSLSSFLPEWLVSERARRWSPLHALDPHAFRLPLPLPAPLRS